MNGYLVAFWCVIIVEIVTVVAIALACIPAGYQSSKGRWDRIKTFFRENNIAIQVCFGVVALLVALICNKSIVWSLSGASIMLVLWLGAPHKPRVKPQVSLQTKVARSNWKPWELKVISGFILLLGIVVIGRLAGFQ